MICKIPLYYFVATFGLYNFQFREGGGGKKPLKNHKDTWFLYNCNKKQNWNKEIQVFQFSLKLPVLNLNSSFFN